MQNLLPSPHLIEQIVLKQTHSYLQTTESQYSPAEKRQCPSSPGCPLTSCSASPVSSDHDVVRSVSHSGHNVNSILCKTVQLYIEYKISGDCKYHPSHATFTNQD